MLTPSRVHISRPSELESQALLPPHGNNDRDVSHPESDLRHQRIWLSTPGATSNKTSKSNIPPHKLNHDVCPHMGQGYPLTGPSPGANPPIYPSSLPPASGNPLSNIFPKSHGFFSFANDMDRSLNDQRKIPSHLFTIGFQKPGICSDSWRWGGSSKDGCFKGIEV